MLLPVKATHQRTREHNVRLVLHTLAEMGPISRAEIARRTRLTRTTVSDVMVELFADGLVEEVGRGPSSGGKAPILLRVPRDARQLIGVDVGDGQVRGAIVNLAGEIHHREEVALGGRDGAEALVRLERLIDRLVSRVSRSGGRPLGIGIGAPGLVDTSTGTVRWAVHLDWRDLPLGARLRARTGLPVYVANDSQAAALAEWTFGRHAPTRGMIVVKVGTGIGAGIIIDGRLYQGDGFGAGEIGHTWASDADLPCRCGRSGCLETVASLPATLSRAARQVASHPESPLAAAAKVRSLTFEDLLEAAAAGDALALEVVLESGAHLGQTLGGVIGALDIHDIVLIGAMTAFGEPWLGAVQAAAQGSALALLSDQARFSVGRLGADVVELGAAALLMTAELGLSLAA